MTDVLSDIFDWFLNSEETMKPCSEHGEMGMKPSECDECARFVDAVTEYAIALADADSRPPKPGSTYRSRKE